MREQAPLQAPELARIARFEELAHQIGGARKEHASLLPRRFDAERDREVRLARADRAGEDQILGRGDPLAAGERVDLRGVDALGCRKVKVSSVLTSGKRASRSRWRITDSWREVCSALSTSCR